MSALEREIALLRPLAATLPCRVTVAMLVRRPWDFYVSWWYYIGARRCGYCGFAKYVGLNPNAQSHLVVGGAPRRYSAALRARHFARDPLLVSVLRTTLAGVDLLGVTERLDEFVFLLCAEAGLRTCPRPSRQNARNQRGTKVTLRGVVRRAMTHASFDAESSTSSSEPLAAAAAANPGDARHHLRGGYAPEAPEKRGEPRDRRPPHSE